MAVVINSDFMGDQVYIDVPTGHEITKLVPLKQHHSKCSAHHGFMCDCAVMKAADLAVQRAKERVLEAEACRPTNPTDITK